MAEQSSALILVVIAAVSIVGIALAALSFTVNRSFGHMMGPEHDMMGQATPDAGPGGVEYSVLALSLLVLVAAIALAWRGRGSQATRVPSPVTSESVGHPPPRPDSPARDESPSQTTAREPVPEPVLMKLLNRDERQMYLEIRNRGGTVLQRDLVALGLWSKAKVTRVLDKLEAKGIVVREAHGMTNRVRILEAAR
ncbi:MAG TPA: MarR family transcriptional regulator [Thermoplasmata archaeon]|jgi:hypothetical protein